MNLDSRCSLDDPQIAEIKQECRLKSIEVGNLLKSDKNGFVFEATKNNKIKILKALLNYKIEYMEEHQKPGQRIKGKHFLNIKQEWFSQNGKFYFQVADKQLCNLFDIMKEYRYQNENIPFNTILTLLRQLCRAIQDIVNNDNLYIHLKPEKILYNIEEKCVKISDQFPYEYMIANHFVVNGSTLPKYLTSEIFKQDMKSGKIFIFSLGLIMIELTTGTLLDNNLIERFKNSKVADMECYLSQDNKFINLNKLILQMIETDECRIDISDLIKEVESLILQQQHDYKQTKESFSSQAKRKQFELMEDDFETIVFDFLPSYESKISDEAHKKKQLDCKKKTLFLESSLPGQNNSKKENYLQQQTDYSEIQINSNIQQWSAYEKQYRQIQSNSFQNKIDSINSQLNSKEQFESYSGISKSINQFESMNIDSVKINQQRALNLQSDIQFSNESSNSYNSYNSYVPQIMSSVVITQNSFQNQNLSEKYKNFVSENNSKGQSSNSNQNNSYKSVIKGIIESSYNTKSTKRNFYENYSYQSLDQPSNIHQNDTQE